MNEKTVPFNLIDTVLLDMDGTLLDKYFDDYFWEHLVPEKYSEKYQYTFGKAKQHLMEKYRQHERTLNWTDLDFWSRELHMDIPALKEQITHLIEIHPHVVEFLRSMRELQKRIFLVTNAHYKSIDLKLKKTQLGIFFDSVLTSFDVGYPKETIEFWQKAEKQLLFDRERTLFIDDTEAVLKTAKQYGIKYLILKARASSQGVPTLSNEFFCISDFHEII
jgi:putative hydrolase of the HAD superfamily